MRKLPLSLPLGWGRARVGVSKTDYPPTLILPRKGGGDFEIDLITGKENG